ncbi:heme oxygenase-like protein [Annulohypoxylon truncatum]|uniref:heme oxygenase-like protein n=1 Tax=Annulohypoxylon truncatum TaxID=327061 RepID=UPI0020085FBA|nr:heme oxygenase-like protein [Annulohypoxylon truncatum]KAI1214600.1 heme oxygenase-like protein [Annulohypoxylon truncatum]
MPSKTQDAGTTPEYRTLGESINIATRPVHTSLNKLIILRLRLALPPHADDASNYVQGLLHIAPIYTTFETLWQEILDTPLHLPTSASGVLLTASSPDSQVSPRIHAILAATHFKALERSAALKTDLTRMTGWNASELEAHLDEVPRESRALAAFLVRVRRTAEQRPHALLAYAWVLYMALFAGGRFIRASLERVDPGDRFWGPLYEGDGGGKAEIGLGAEDEEDEDEDDDEGNRSPRMRMERMPGAFPTSASVSMSVNAQQGRVRKAVEKAEELQHPSSFFRFDTPADGQDLRQAFKARVAEATDVLTPGEIEDVVNEARDIFEQMISLVGELDDVCGTEYEATAAAAA